MMRVFLLSSLLLLTTALSAKQQPSLLQVGERLRIKKGLQVDFEQRVLTIRQKVRLTQGKGYFHPDGRFRWVIMHRGEMVRTYVYDRQTITEYLPAEKTANIWNISSAKTDAIARIVALLKSPHQLKRDYTVQHQQHAKQTLQLSLVPRQSSDIATIAVSINLTANFISKVRINYRNRRYNEFAFRNPQRQRLDAARFKFSSSRGNKSQPPAMTHSYRQIKQDLSVECAVYLVM